MPRLSHLDARGRVRMVDVSAKAETLREAIARGRVRMQAATLALLKTGRSAKGDVLAAAHLAAVMAAKRTGEWIPLAHPLRIEAVEVAFHLEPKRPGVSIEAMVRTTGRTGVEMEALTAVAAAALTLVDMLKAVDRTLVVEEIALWEKRGGRSGEWIRPAGAAAARSRRASGAGRTRRAPAARRKRSAGRAPVRRRRP